jgi:hypothetical protein
MARERRPGLGEVPRLHAHPQPGPCGDTEERGVGVQLQFQDSGPPEVLDTATGGRLGGAGLRGQFGEPGTAVRLQNLTSLAVEGGPFEVGEAELRSTLENAGWEITWFERDVITVAGVDGLPVLPVWVVEATAASRGACAATTT